MENENKIPINSSIEFTPENPFTIDIPVKEGEEKETGFPGFPVEPEKPGFIETATAEFQELASNYHELHAASSPLTEPANAQVQFFYPDVNDKFYHPAPAGWSPKQEIEKQTNLDPKFIPKLMNAKNPDDFQFQLDSVNEQAHRDEVLQNGSTLARIIGGAVGLSPIGSIENWIPLTAIASKAKFTAGFVAGLSKNLPGLLTASAIRSGAQQMDKIDGNLPDFLKDTFIDGAFATVFFGAAGAAKPLINLSELNRLKQFARDNLDGIGFNFKVDAKGNLKGYEAVDTTGGSISAAKLSKAQEQADSAFYKGGLLKIPYVGTGALHLLSGNVPGFKYLAGSPLIRVLTSKYKAANAFGDAGFDHFITTENIMKGGVKGDSFESKFKQTRAMLTSLYTQTDTLHAERNGYKITARPTLGIQNAWSAIKQKSIETLSKESQSTDWVSKETFMDEVQRVLYSEDSSEHAAVNNAASLYRKVIDSTWGDYRKAHNLPDDWLPPKTSTAYLMRVYDTQYLGSNAGETAWMEVIPKWLKDSDELINQRMTPIREIDQRIEQHKANHENLIRSPNKTDRQIVTSVEKLATLKAQKKSLEEGLQNELRENPELNIHVDDSSLLSAKEAEQLNQLTKARDIAAKEIAEQKAFIADMKSKISKTKSSAMKAKTVATGKKQIRRSDTGELALGKEEDKLRTLELEHEEEVQKIHDAIASGKVSPRLYYRDPESARFILKNPNERLKFRDVHESDFHRNTAAEAYYNSIMNMRPEDIVADVFGKISGNKSENALKSRTLMIPDEILYNNNFLTKDLYAKTANYVNYLARRTHLKTSFNNVTVNGSFEELAENLLEEYQSNRELINNRIAKLKDPKQIKKEEKNLRKEEAEFNAIKNDMKTLYETRMLGINKRDDFTNGLARSLMSLTAAVNLHNLPAQQITDLFFAGFQHGIWPSIRDGILPLITSLNGILKTKNSEALREMAPHINLGFQDVGNNYADRNWHSELQPYINMGKVVSGIEKYAHFSALTDLSPYIDNAIQRTNGSIIQSHFMDLLHRQLKGELSEKDSRYLRKYGIDPKVWAERMVKAYKEAEGFQTNLGGYMSKSWKWQDLEAANVFNNGVFRGIQNTLVNKGMGDSPFFADNIFGLFFHTFTGWTYAATNRYLIPSLQHPDGEMLLKMMWMLGAGAMVSPARRLSRGEDAWPDDMTDAQIAYEAYSDSGVFSSISNVMNMANFLSDDKLLGNLKNDKYRNRVKTGIFGMSDVVSSTISRISDVLDMVHSGLDEKDLKTAARMLPITGAMYSHYYSDKVIEGWGLPRNKRAAENS